MGEWIVFFSPMPQFLFYIMCIMKCLPSMVVVRFKCYESCI